MIPLPDPRNDFSQCWQLEQGQSVFYPKHAKESLRTMITRHQKATGKTFTTRKGCGEYAGNIIVWRIK